MVQTRPLLTEFLPRSYLDLNLFFCLQLLLHLEGEEGEELGEEAFVHVLVHLVQEEPVPNAEGDQL